ncbi:MAG TPA: hypothetical protein DCS87_11575 [Rheinheimera sp.]|nr:hypothetical protein [Rheinheimera sp.]
MADRSKEIKDNVAKMLDGFKVIDSKDAERKFDAAFFSFANFCMMHKENHSADELLKLYKDQPDASLNYRIAKETYLKMQKCHESATNEDSRIVRLERKLAIQALIFRVLNTFLLGASILCLYWFANKYGIPLPLLSKSLNGPI